jgi:DNA-binding protein HU-beta
MAIVVYGRELVNKAELIDALAERLGEKKSATVALDAVLAEIQATVTKGDKVSITGFGVFEKRTRAARMARNPRTGEAVKVKKTAVPAFRAGAGFKEMVATGKAPKAVAPARTTAAKKTTATASTTAAAKKSSPATATAKKTTATKTTARKTAPAKTAPAKKAVVKKAAVKKTAAKTTVAAKTTGAKATAKKAPAKTVAKKAPAKKAAR